MPPLGPNSLCSTAKGAPSSPKGSDILPPLPFLPPTSVMRHATTAMINPDPPSSPHFLFSLPSSIHPSIHPERTSERARWGKYFPPLHKSVKAAAARLALGPPVARRRRSGGRGREGGRERDREGGRVAISIFFFSHFSSPPPPPPSFLRTHHTRPMQ